MIAMRTRLVATSVASLALFAAACSSGESVQQAGEGGGDTADVAATEAPVTEAESTDTESTDTGSTDAEASVAEGSDVTSEGGDDADTTTSTEPAPSTTLAALADEPPCPVDALDDAEAPVQITFWHAMTNELEAALIDLTDQYNASQDRVVVTIQNQTSYDSSIDKYILSSPGSRPHLLQLPEYTLQSFAQSGTFIPAGACLEASGFDTEPFLPRSLTAYQFEGIQWAMPFNISDPVLYYNRRLFQEAGLDPDGPPITLEDLRATSQQLVDSGAAGVGIVLDTGPNSGGGWYLEQWFGRVGEPYADNGNGRLAPATEVLYDNELGVELLTFLQGMIADGLAANVGDNPDGSASLLKLADPEDPGAMTIGSSAALGSVISALVPGLGPEDIGVGPMPGPSAEPSVQVGGGSLWIVADKGDAEAAAAWDYITFLTSAQSQSTWASRTGYVPVREDAIEIEPLAAVYAADPRFRVAYDQLLARADDLAANAPVLGPMREVRDATATAVAAVFNGADPASSLAEAAEQSNTLIESYNARN
jgi:sn-glycerol 3-phosphate transport system substrate-binding protein